jgi:hypothetical protein
MSRWMPLLQKAVSWGGVLWCLIVAIVALALAGSREIWDGLDIVRISGFAVLGFSSLVSSWLLILTRRHQATRVLLITGPIAMLLVCAPLYREVGQAFVLGSLLFTVACGLPVIFWLLVDRYNWPPLLGKHVWPRRIQFTLLCIASVAVVVLVFAGAVQMAALNAHGINIDCGGHPTPFSQATDNDHSAFIAQVLYVHPGPNSVGWAITSVDKRYFGLRPWNRRFAILLWGASFELREKYFVDGRFHRGLLTRLIPLIDFRPCNRSGLLKDAQVSLRVLDSGSAANGARLIGHVTKIKARLHNEKADANAVRVEINGRSLITAQTDDRGIFDVQGLPPGEYHVTLGQPFNCSSLGCSRTLSENGIAECDLQYDSSD